jgi:Tfp pilus assembly protein PilF
MRFIRPAGLGLILVGVIVAYSNSLRVPFLLDDFGGIVNNPAITRPSSFASLLLPPPHVYTAGRPVLNLSFALNYAVGGNAVGGYHLVNLAIHLAAALTLFGVVRRVLELTRFQAGVGEASTLLALLIAGLWALHPVQTVSVTYLSQRAESLMGLWYLLTVYCFIRGAGGGGHHWTALAVVVCALGMATKEVMVTAPVFVFLLDAVVVAGSFRRAWTKRWRVHLALCSTWTVLVALMIVSEPGRRAIGMAQGIPWYNYVRIEVVAVMHYLRLALWPVRLVFDYGPNLPVPTWRELFIPIIMLGTIGVVSVRQLSRLRISGFLGCAFLLLLAPTSSVIPVAGQPIAENRMYLPLALLLTAFVAGAAVAGARRGYLILFAAIAGLGWLSHERNEQFRSAVVLWTDTVAKQPGNYRAWVYLAEALKSEGRNGEAVDVLLAALRRWPQSAEMENNVGAALFGAGRAADALPHFEAATALNPKYAEAYYNLGVVLFHGQNFPAALQCFLTHLQIAPETVEVHNYTGLALFRSGNTAAAIPHFRRAVELDPNHAGARANLELALAQTK